MDKYVATKPVRFDRTYIVGESIPEHVIDSRSVKRLMDAGKIAIAPTSDLLDNGKEEIVTFLEDILGINRDDSELPDLEARGALCNKTISEIRTSIELLKAEEAKENAERENDEEPTEVQEALIDTDNMCEMPIELPATCLVCGKKCGNKAALTKHMKEHTGE